MSLLEIRNLHVTVAGHEILKGIELNVNAGEVHSIMGPNGSGKSTLAQVLSRRQTYEVTAGEVLLDGKDLLAMKPEEAACEGVFCEPASAASIAGMMKLAKKKTIPEGSTVVCVLTGHGLKDPDNAVKQGTKPIEIPCKVSAVIKELGY